MAAALLLAGCGTGGAANAGAPPDLQNGETLFKGSGTCGSCHTLAAAGTAGTIGPNLDNAFAGDVAEGYPQSSIENVVLDQIRLGSGQVDAQYTSSKYFIEHCLPPHSNSPKCYTQPMPADLVKGQDAIDVAAYVASVAGQGGYTTSGGFAGVARNERGGDLQVQAVGAPAATRSPRPGRRARPARTSTRSSRARRIVAHQVMVGGGVMPSFQGKLSPAQIQAVAKYVSSSAGK